MYISSWTVVSDKLTRFREEKGETIWHYRIVKMENKRRWWGKLLDDELVLVNVLYL
jgi:hypothetical protein